MSLQKHIDFAASNKINARYQFPVVLTQLICTRSVVCIEAMDSNVQFFELAIETLHSEFSNVTNKNASSHGFASLGSPSLLLVQAIAVILGIWNEQHVSNESKFAVKNMADALLYRDDNDADSKRSIVSVDSTCEGKSMIPLENV
jgi:hypothetical protein